MRSFASLAVVLACANLGALVDRSVKAPVKVEPKQEVLSVPPGMALMGVAIRDTVPRLDLRAGGRADVLVRIQQPDGNVLITPLFVNKQMLAVDANLIFRNDGRLDLVVSFGFTRAEAELLQAARKNEWDLYVIPRKQTSNALSE